MKRFTFTMALLLAGLAIGIPTGYFYAEQTAPEATANPNVLNIAVPKNYFADLPKTENGDQRLLKVDTFTFETKSTSGATEETVVVLPRIALSKQRR